MAGVAKGIIDIQINTGSAAAELKALQNQINSFNAALAKGNLSQGKFFSDYTKDLSKAINSSGVFTSEFMRMNSAASTLDNTLKKGKGTLGQFFSAAFNKNSSAFASTMELAARRAATLQTQFINTGASAKGMGEALAIRPLDAFSSKAAIAAERQALLNTMFRQGTTHMINFGKNVQWAGRQLMVGFTVPMTVLGTVAGRTFMDIEKQLVNLKKVYGDAFTTPEELNQNVAQVRQLAEEFTKYGIAVKDTIGMAANAAASGARNADLIDATRQATRLATLGQMEQQEALKTTIALQSAFRLSGEELADTINFLNMVENQTVVSLQDLSAAIPRVAPVIKGLGGDVKDMSVFLAAMQEGGVSAEQGANALKSGLASLINPTKAATETLSGFGINLEKIVSTNRGDLMGTVFAFGEALKGLDDFSKQQALEKVFGKYQYARLGALFENIVRDGSQASQVLNLMEYDVTALRASAEKELSAVENALGTQLIAAVEKLKLSLEPIGKIFVEMAIPVVNFLTKIVEKFDGLSDGQKKFAAIAAVIVGVVVPAGTMFLGLLINLLGTLGKITHGFGIFGKAMIKGGPVAAVKALTQSTKYLSIEELEAAGAAKQLASSTQIANAAMLEQATSTGVARNAVAGLVAEYRALIAVQQQAAASRPGFGVAGAAGAAAAGGVKTGAIRMRGLRRNKGGEIFMSGGTTVPGVGNTDTVPAMLTPGEFVVNKEATAQNYALLDAINSGNKFNNGGMIPGVQYFAGRMPNRMVKPRRGPGAFGQPGVESSNTNIASARRRALLEDMGATQGAQRGSVPLATTADERYELTHMLSRQDQQIRNIAEVKQITNPFLRRIFEKIGGSPITLQNGFTVRLPFDVNQNLRRGGSGFSPSELAQRLENVPASRMFEPISAVAGRLESSVNVERIKAQLIERIRRMDPSKTLMDADIGPIYQSIIKKNNPEIYKLLKNPMQFRTETENIYSQLGIAKPSDISKPEVISRLEREGFRVLSNEEVLSLKSLGGIGGNYQDPEGRVGIYRAVSASTGKPGKISFVASNNQGSGTVFMTSGTGPQNFVPRQLSGLERYLTTGGSSGQRAQGLNAGGAVQYFGARMPNRVVKSSQIKKFSGQKVADSEGHSSRFNSLAGVYDVNGRKMFVKPFQTLEEAQAELIGNAARRKIAGTATPGSRIVRMDGPDGEIFATTAPMIPGMKPGATLPTRELLKQIPASSMLGDMDATAGNILSTGGGRLVTVDPGAAGVKFIRNAKGVFRRATGSEISFGSEATNSGSYTARAITQVLEKTGASKDFVKMLGDAIARDGLTKSQFTKLYDDVVESSISRVSSFKLPSRIGDRTKLDEAAKAAGYKDADEAYSAIMLRDLTSIRGLGGDIYSSASRFQGMLKANSGTLVPGMGNTDTVPAMLTPGEFVVNKDATKNNLPLLQAINNGNAQGLNSGGIAGVQYFAKENRQRMVLPTLPGMPSRRASIMMGISDPYQLQSRSNTGQGVFKDTSATLSSTAKKMISTFKTISANNMVYAKAGEKYFQTREAVERQVIKQQAFNVDRMVKINAGLAQIGPTMKAGTNLLKTTMNNAANSLASSMKNRMAAMKTPEAKEARAARMQKVGQGMMMASMIPMMASSFVENPKQQNALMGVGAAMAIIPMLQQFGKTAGTVTAGVGILTAGFVMMRKHIDGLAKSSAVAGANLGGAANRMEGISAATGYSFASTRSGMEDYRFTEKQAQGASEIMPFFDTDQGKKMVEDLKKSSSEERYKKVASMLEMAIADGMDPTKAEAFGTAVAFAIDDKLLKSKVIGLMRSGTLQSGSEAMISSIEKRQTALNKELPEVKSGPSANESFAGAVASGAITGAIIGGVGTSWSGPFSILGAAIGGTVGAITAATTVLYVQKKEIEANIAAVGKTFGSSIQVLKELNNAEALLNEERKNGVITNEEFEVREKKIQEIRQSSYENIQSAVVNTADAGATQQTISDQLQLSGFQKDAADLVARQTNRDTVSAEVFGQADFEKLDKAQQEIIGSVIASTIDGMTPENYGLKLGDVKEVWALYKDKLLEASADGTTPTAQEMQAMMESAQLERFVGATIASSPYKDYDAQAVAADMQQAITDSGTTLSFTQIESALTELGDPDLAIKIGTNADSIKNLESVLNTMPDGFDLSMYTKYLNGDTEFTNPDDYTKSIQDTIDGIAKIAPEGFDPIQLFKLFEESGSKDPLKDAETAFADAQSLMDKIGGDEAAVKSVVFESTGYDMTQKEVDAFNALPPSEQKTYLTSFVIASMQVGAMPELQQQTDGRGAGAVAAANAKIKADYANKIKEQAAFIQSLNLGGGGTVSPTDGPGGGGGGAASSGSGKMTKKGAKKWIKDAEKETKTLKAYRGAIDDVVNGTNAEAISMIPQDVYMKLSNANREKAIEAMKEQIKQQDKLNAILAVASIQENTIDLGKQLSATKTLVSTGINPEILAMIDMNTYLNLTTEQRKEYIKSLEAQTEAEKELNAVKGLADLKQTVNNLKDQVNVTNQLVSSGISGEIAGLVDVTIYQNLSTAAKAEYIAELKKQLDIQRQLDWLTKSSEERALESIDLLSSAIDMKNIALENQLNQIERENELYQREINTRNRALELLSRQEEIVNKAYDDRIDALDKVAKANDRIAAQERSRIDLASALASGDIAAAANAASAIQQQESEYRIEDARAALEAKRQADLKSLTISVNGVLMTRADIERSIRDYSDKIYANEQLMIGVQDDLYDNSVEQAKLDEASMKLQQRMLLIQQKRNIEAQRLLTMTDQQKRDFQDQIDAYNAAVVESEAAGITTPGQAANTDLGAGGGGGAADNITAPVVPEVPPVVTPPVVTQPVVTQPSAPTLPEGHIAGDALFNTMVDQYKKLDAESKENFFKITELRPGPGFGNWIAARLKKPKRTIENANLNHLILKVLNNGIVRKSDVDNDDDNVNFTKHSGGDIPSLGILGSKYGTVPGIGGMDSIKTALTPGEFVVRKPMVQKYGLPLLEAINSGAFRMPEMGQPTFGTGGSNRYTIPESGKTQGAETMYNNTYNVNVNVAGTDASPDDIANVVMAKLSQQNRGNLRSYNY